MSNDELRIFFEVQKYLHSQISR